MVKRRRRREAGGALLQALSTLAPVGKGVALGLAKALGKRAVKTGTRATRGAALEAASAEVGYGVGKIMRRKRHKKRGRR